MFKYAPKSHSRRSFLIHARFPAKWGAFIHTVHFGFTSYLQALITDQLCQFMDKYCLFSTDQSGFLRLNSTLTCRLKSTDDWYRGLDLGKLVWYSLISKRPLTQLTTAFSDKSYNIMVFVSVSFPGLYYTYPTGTVLHSKWYWLKG